MTRVTVAMLGARRHYAVPRILHEAGLLERFYTDSYIGNKRWLESALRTIPEWAAPHGLQRWLGRKDPVLPMEKVTSFEFFGWHYVWLRHWARNEAELTRTYAEAARSFSRRIIADQPHKVDAVWGYNGACLELLQWAKARGIRCIVEQTIAPLRIQQRLLAEELERWPNWQPGIDTMSYPSPLSEREEAEWTLADRIVAGSEFVAEGLEAGGTPMDRIRVAPYGVDAGHFQPVDASHRQRRLRILFAGEVGLRKGVPYLLHALRLIGAGKVDARLAGHLSLAPEMIAPFRDVAEFLGPVPRPAMLELYRWADLLVLPTIVEGSATVTYEALASGLPVITTAHAGSVVRDSVEGFIIPIRDIGALKKSFEQLIEDRALTGRLAAAARRRALDFTLEKYRERLLAVLRDLA